MKIIYTSSECTPFIKTGGLADIVAALSKAVAKVHEVSFFLPLYRSIKQDFSNQLQYIGEFTTLDNHLVKLFTLKNNNITYYFIDSFYLFERDHLYGYMDDGFRFGFFNRAILDSIGYLEIFPDIIHNNDWQTGLIAYMLKTYHQRDYRYQSIKTVFTIHNIEYQGIFNLNLYYSLHLEYSHILEFNHQLNFMKTALMSNDWLTTVSKTYRNETLTPQFSNGMHNILQWRQEHYIGILNGIDTQVFNPEYDNHIFQKYNEHDFSEVKGYNKIKLYQKLNLNNDYQQPLFIMITRLTGQKGLDILCELLEQLLKIHQATFIILGTGEKKYSDYFHHLSYHYTNLHFYNYYDETLAHQLYAAGDFLLMPSAFEPSGLAQMIALKYATIPIVHTTGGLKDSITHYNKDTKQGNGITFGFFSAHSFQSAINFAMHIYYESPYDFHQLRLNALNCDFSINKTVDEYLKLYERMHLTRLNCN